jgi:hypothetical protein
MLGAVALGLNVFGGTDPAETSSGGTLGDTSSANNSLPADEQCTEEIMSNPRWVCLTSAVMADGKLTVAYRSDGAGFDLNGIHLHLYGSDGKNPPDRVMGKQASESEQGEWFNAARIPAVLDLADARFGAVIGDAEKVCARIADGQQLLVKDEGGAYATGNCVPITRTETVTTPVTEQEGGGGGDGGGDGGGNEWPQTTDEPTSEEPTDEPTDVPTDDVPTDAPTDGGGAGKTVGG